MKLEDQVPSLELCKRLKELGYPQDSLFWWNDISEAGTKWNLVIEDNIESNVFISAPTVAELINVLQNLKQSSIIVAKDDKRVADTLALEFINYEKNSKI